MLWEIVKRYDKEMARSSSSCRRQQRWNMVANLRQRFFHYIEPGGLAEDRRAVVPASGMVSTRDRSSISSCARIWEDAQFNTGYLSV
nr:protein ROOT HAIR DEFECTIVE 3-like isoform X2 [Ipomoea trifida]